MRAHLYLQADRYNVDSAPSSVGRYCCRCSRLSYL